MAGALSRFSNYPLLPEIDGRPIAATFPNDWIRAMGKPRRIVLGNGWPGFNGPEWSEISNIPGWQIIQEPLGSSNQNGLRGETERVVKIAAENFATSESMKTPSQLISRQADIAQITPRAQLREFPRRWRWLADATYFLDSHTLSFQSQSGIN